MVGYNFGPPAIDFSPLGKLGETYDRSVKRARDAEVAANRERALATFGQNSDLAALGQTLLRAGDLEGGMSALRLAAANEGTPWQKQRAAAEDERANRALEIAERERQKADERYRENLERQDRPVRVTEPGRNEFGDETRRQGWQYPNGIIKWEDGTETRAPGPQSGGAGDPNLPVVGGIPVQFNDPGANRNAPVTATGQPEYGYDIPITGQRLPHGTIRLPGAPAEGPALPVAAPQGTVAVAAPPTPPVTAPTQQAPIAAPAGQVAVAAPPEPTVPAARPTATQINAGTSNIAPMTNAEMIAEARRLGIRPGEYRKAREEAIAKEMAAKATGVDSAKSLGADAGKLAVAEQYLANAPKIREAIARGDQTGFWDRTMAANKIGERGAIQNQIESGVDALVHMMTGAGMNESEARRKVGRYEPGLLDTPESLLAKHDHLVGELKHWRDLAYRGKGVPGDLPPPSPAYGADSKPLEVGGKREVGGGVLERVK